MNHYVYRISNIILNKHYYGVRSCKCDPKYDLGVKYFSSSTDNVFINEQHENPSYFKYKIIKIFKNRIKANAYENKLHKKFNVHKNKMFYNTANPHSPFFTRYGKKPWNYGKTNIYSQETLKKISKASTGRKFSKETKELLSKQRLGNTYKKGIREKQTTKLLKSKNATVNNSMAKRINIYDNNGILRFECYSNFKKICKENNLPCTTLRRSYINNTVVKFGNGYSKKFIEDNIKYDGWYARIIL